MRCPREQQEKNHAMFFFTYFLRLVCYCWFSFYLYTKKFMLVQYNPHISVDCVIFGFDQDELKILLIRPNGPEKDPFQDKMKLPGSLIIRFEELNQSAHRVLEELTGLKDIFLKQFGVFDKPDRLADKNDLEWLKKQSHLEIKRVITIAYYSLIQLDQSRKTTLSKEHQATWYSLDQLPSLMFDHHLILQEALKNLQNEISTEPLAFELLPGKFTLNQLQNLYEAILGIKIDNRNFRKKINRLKYIEALNEWQSGVPHKPAQFFTYNEKEFSKFKKKNALIII